MTEAVFPLLGALTVVLMVLPMCALVAKAGLVWIERRSTGPFERMNRRFLLIAGSSALPLAWLLSAAVHQAESGQSVLACLFVHGTAAVCLEAAFFGLILAGLTTVQAVRAMRTAQSFQPSASSEAQAVARRVARLTTSSTPLREISGQVIVTDDVGVTIGTQGWFSPRVFLGVAFANRLSDEMLAGALSHESEHVRLRDPLRYLLLQLALSLNPFGRFLLAPHIVRWHAAREAYCDREAVIAGSSPLSLADAIVLAARPASPVQPALGAPDTVVLKFRVAMLLAFAENGPSQPCERSPSPLPTALGLLLITLLLPHQTGTAPLDALHTGAEQALTFFWR